ncbi:hypothetical protein [Mesoplasma coleopterae]|uniref:ParB/Sulfiredoxin domain-containing protein n=1 Tax=Mesoplasma coleopterae TaxID=324078 RepID=A0A2K8P536_9MOLU|nr:hypothetical protein [Mesoplasma coleopterae]ATZ20843.1 hypothetical protein MCOLE_v1c03290 [Mesoplasma coleopterae]
MQYNNKEIRMLPSNPRYTVMEEIDFKDLYFSKYSIIETAKELLKYEGDFSELLDLIKAIKENGFISLNDNILLHLDNKQENYYVLEGNRRILAINLIKKNLIIDELIEDTPNFENTDKNEWLKNIKEIKKTISEFGNLDIEHEWFKDVTSFSSEFIWKSIYTKHIGEQIGKREWSRAKYFDDLLKKYLNFLKTDSKEIAIKRISNLFGKKESIIKQDIKSSIWIIKSIEMYNSTNENKIDYRQMEVSGYELVLSQKLNLMSEEKTIRNILGVEIDTDKIELSFKIKNYESILSFLIQKSIEKKITTRGIKPEIFDELGDLLGQSIYNKKTLDYKMRQLSKINDENLSVIEKSEKNFLINIKSEDLKPNSFEINKWDSKFVQSIKRMMSTELKTIKNLKNYNENEYPITNISLVVRNVIDLLILEFFYRIGNYLDEIPNYKNIFNEKTIKDIKEFHNNYNFSEKHEVNDLTAHITNLVQSKGTSFGLQDSLVEIVIFKYKDRLKELEIDITSDEFTTTLSKILSYKRYEENNKQNGFKLLNDLVHKPYMGYEIIENREYVKIDNINEMFSTIKFLLKILKIWEEKK